MIEQRYKGRTIKLEVSRYSRGTEVYICIAEWDGRTASVMGSSEAEVRKKAMDEVRQAIDEEEANSRDSW